MKSLQLFGMPFQQLFANTWSFSHRTTNIWLLISDTMSIFQTDAGNIILTLSKLHIRAVHHTLSEIGTKRWCSYQGIAIKRNYNGQKLLVEANGKHGFDLKTLSSISNHSSSFYRDSRALPISPLAATDPFGWWGYYLFHPWPWLRHLSSDLISHPALYRVQQRECLPHSYSVMFEEEKNINRHSTLTGSTSDFIALQISVILHTART